MTPSLTPWDAVMKEVLMRLFGQAGSPYLPLAFELYPQVVTEELLMSKRST